MPKRQAERAVIRGRTRKPPYRGLTSSAVAAMWLFGERYARSGSSAKDFYAGLPPYDRALADRLAQEIIATYLNNVARAQRAGAAQRSRPR